MAASIASYVIMFFMWIFLALFAGIFLIILGVAGYVGWRLLKYRIHVDIYEKVGKTFIGFGDYAREVIHSVQGGKEKTYLQLLKGLKGMKRIPLPESATYIPFGMRKKVNILYRDGIFCEMPIIENSDPAITFEPSKLLRVLQSWDVLSTRNRELHSPKQGFWDKYGNQFMWGLLIFMQFVLFLILIMQLKGGGGSASLPQLIT